MKKFLTSVAILAMGFVSCSKNEVIETNDTKSMQIIGFNAYSQISTKGTPINNNEDFKVNGNKFGVTAFIKQSGWDTPYMGGVNAGVPILSDGAKWDYSSNDDKRFWPAGNADEELSFFAYTPYEDASRASTVSFSKDGGMVFTDYVVPQSNSEQKDFMYSSRLNVTKNDREISSNNLKLTFKHALTQIVFKINVTSPDMTVEIDEISLCNIESKGTFTLKGATDNFTGSAVGVWNIIEGNKTNYSTVLNENKVIKYHATDYTEVTTKDGALMLLPQNFEAWDISKSISDNDNSDKKSYFKAKVKIYTTDINGKTLYLHGSADNSKYIYIPVSSKQNVAGEWLQGKRIAYKLKFGDHDGSTGGGGLDENGKPVLATINFDTDVDPWNDNDENVDL